MLDDDEFSFMLDGEFCFMFGAGDFYSLSCLVAVSLFLA